MASESGYDNDPSDYEYPSTDGNMSEDWGSFEDYPPRPQVANSEEPPCDVSGLVQFSFNIQMEAAEKESIQDYRSAYELYKRHISESLMILQRTDFGEFKDRFDNYIKERLKESEAKCEELEVKLYPSGEQSLGSKLKDALEERESQKQMNTVESVEGDEIEDEEQTRVPVIKVVYNKIEEVEADAIAVTANKYLTLRMGRGLSQLIYDRGGRGIQTELLENCPKELGPGEVVKSSSGNMTNCSTIYHGYLPPLFKEEKKEKKSENCYQALLKLVQNLLRMTTEDGIRTLAMVPFGTGGLGYDNQKVAHTMYQAVGEFFAKSSSSLETIFFVIRPKSSPLLKKVFLLEDSSYILNSKEVTDLMETFEELQQDNDVIHEARFEMKNIFLQVTNGNFEQAKEIAENMIIIWNLDHISGKRVNPIISCFDESTQKKIHLQYGTQLKRKELQFARDDTSLPGTQLIHVRCDSDSDDDVTKALVNGLKQTNDKNLRTISLLVKTDGTRPWQPHIAAKNIVEATKKTKTQHSILRVVLLDRCLFIPFLTAMMDMVGREMKHIKMTSDQGTSQACTTNESKKE